MVQFQVLDPDPCVSRERPQTKFIIVQTVLQNTASSFFKRVIIGGGGGGNKKKMVPDSINYKVRVIMHIGKS